MEDMAINLLLEIAVRCVLHARRYRVQGFSCQNKSTPTMQAAYDELFFLDGLFFIADKLMTKSYPHPCPGFYIIKISVYKEHLNEC